MDIKVGDILICRDDSIFVVKFITSSGEYPLYGKRMYSGGQIYYLTMCDYIDVVKVVSAEEATSHLLSKYEENIQFFFSN
ncbi:hypothetical protein A2533_04460 [Candidatus Falkowbacteria bacterium RIFOXYD2_FULL_35_9]|uniref:Uncharacterized protein n=1 Tax=Candidatus Falkowbacteria bacterium RIFOXYC2_FULL_36_12 TaxID=1798002 RepID=A0A1F5T0D9_9BACT|nr:MAG: hypothetical protein A2300_04115 [Candidatus Falkowbacteria bacterium RIFOXYB2_FULL_35_7]OGF32379.1 MAG: hypothetical protein A2478_03610 [Candidatus Falkowbacteria bacterium RIFOXYC2_FULL_36_12]OGF34737.1 MAG: hypothetical protein A2223_00945 [Candidatus Falkowbacteria bacterium RIFOXYA2_FULL_35_8]OGF48370.1 MAG: hypothetical protein A2533_04460 [Candidatus Falkowbacteria bacterium RIFOXYD2_FULL_35_9]